MEAGGGDTNMRWSGEDVKSVFFSEGSIVLSVAIVVTEKALRKNTAWGPIIIRGAGRGKGGNKI